jgi:hypothetical protein
VLITELQIPEGVISIGNYAFYGCDCLTSVTIPNSVTAIGKEAFYGCRLERLTFDCNIPDGMNQLSYYHEALSSTYFDTLVIGDNVTTIGDYAFSGFNRNDKWWENNEYVYASQLKAIYIGKSVENIGEGAFYNCTNLTELYVHRDVPPTLKSSNDLSAATIYVPYMEYYVYRGTNCWKEFADNIVAYDFINKEVVDMDALMPDFIYEGENYGKGVLIDGLVWAPVTLENYISHTGAEYYSPEGWRLPTTAEFMNLVKNHSEFNNGYFFTGSQPYSKDIPQIKLAANGRVYWPEDSDRESYQYKGEKGFYWSSDRVGAYGGYALELSATGIYTSGINLFEYGCSAHYVKEFVR